MGEERMREGQSGRGLAVFETVICAAAPLSSNRRAEDRVLRVFSHRVFDSCCVVVGDAVWEDGMENIEILKV